MSEELKPVPCRSCGKEPRISPYGDVFCVNFGECKEQTIAHDIREWNTGITDKQHIKNLEKRVKELEAEVEGLKCKDPYQWRD